jgi:hypothetical protein
LVPPRRIFRAGCEVFGHFSIPDRAERNSWVEFSRNYAFKMHNFKDEEGYAAWRYLNRSLSAGAYPGSRRGNESVK